MSIHDCCTALADESDKSEDEDEEDNGMPPNREAGSAGLGIDQERHEVEEKEEHQVWFTLHRCISSRGVQIGLRQ